jgi:hypothetical protein
MYPAAKDVPEDGTQEAARTHQENRQHANLPPRIKNKPLLQIRFEVGVINPPDANGLTGEPHRRHIQLVNMLSVAACQAAEPVRLAKLLVRRADSRFGIAWNSKPESLQPDQAMAGLELVS